MRIVFSLLYLTSAVSAATARAQEVSYKDGDIIFHESQSSQSMVIKEVTGSRWSHVGMLFQQGGKWFVAEAVEPVRLTPLASFVSRGKKRSYRVYRLPSLTEAQAEALWLKVKSFLGIRYDIYFEWSDQRIYCSELVYKAFMAATGVEIGAVQKFADLRLDGPYAKELIRRRLNDTGRTLNPEEEIVTPVSQVQDSDLVLVEKSGS